MQERDVKLIRRLRGRRAIRLRACADPLRGEGILAFRDCGRDILGRVRAAGSSEVFPVAPPPPWFASRDVVARKGIS